MRPGLLCPHCRVVVSVAAEAALLPVVCGGCGELFTVGVPSVLPSAGWTDEAESDSRPLPLRFHAQNRGATRGFGIFPAMALIFVLVVLMGLGSVAWLQSQPKKLRATAPSEEIDPESLDPAQAGERKAGGGPPVVEYKSEWEDPSRLQSATLETALPGPKAEPAPPLFRGGKPNPKPQSKDVVWSAKPPPP